MLWNTSIDSNAFERSALSQYHDQILTLTSLRRLSFRFWTNLQNKIKSFENNELIKTDQSTYWIWINWVLSKYAIIFLEFRSCFHLTFWFESGEINVEIKTQKNKNIWLIWDMHTKCVSLCNMWNNYIATLHLLKHAHPPDVHVRAKKQPTATRMQWIDIACTSFLLCRCYSIERKRRKKTISKQFNSYFIVFICGCHKFFYVRLSE